MTMRYLKSEFWTDPYTENLDPSEKLLYIYLLTNPLCNVAGIYETRISRIAYETGFDKEMVEKILNRFKNDKKILKIDNWIVVINFVKNQSNNPSVLLGVQRILSALPEKISQAVTGCPQAVGYYTLLNLTLPYIRGHTNFKKTKVKKKTITNFIAERREESGNDPVEKIIPTEEQKIAFAQLSVLDYFHKKGVDYGFEYLLEEDEQANKKFAGLSRAFKKRYKDNWKEVIDWWFDSPDNAWSDYNPSNFFSINTYMKFDNRGRNKAKDRSILRFDD